MEAELIAACSMGSTEGKDEWMSATIPVQWLPRCSSHTVRASRPFVHIFVLYRGKQDALTSVISTYTTVLLTTPKMKSLARLCLSYLMGARQFYGHYTAPFLIPSCTISGWPLYQGGRVSVLCWSGRQNIARSQNPRSDKRTC